MNVPKLRFKADDGSEFPEWEEKRLGDICEPLMYGMGAAAIPYDGQNKYIRITDIDDESHKYKSNDIVSPAGMLEEKYLVCKGDILLARTGASTGKSYLYDEKDGKMYFAGFLIKAHVNEECDAKFIYAQTLTTKYMNWVKLTSMRSGQPGINANEYSSYAVSIACIPEQQKIASFLSTIDEIIQSTESELTAWQERKKGVMQKIFNREVRFKADDGSEFPEWEEKKMTQLFTRIVEKNRTDLSPLTIIQGQGTVRRDESDRRIAYDKKGLKNYKAVKKDDFIVHLRSFEGGLEIANQDGIVSPAYHVYRGSGNVCPQFYYPYFRSNNFIKGRLAICVTGVRDGKNIEMDTFDELLLPCPSLPEQKKIADGLSSLENVISQIQAELSAWKTLKKGLLQQMFV